MYLLIHALIKQHLNYHLILGRFKRPPGSIACNPIMQKTHYKVGLHEAS